MTCRRILFTKFASVNFSYILEENQEGIGLLGRNCGRDGIPRLVFPRCGDWSSEQSKAESLSKANYANQVGGRRDWLLTL